MTRSSFRVQHPGKRLAAVLPSHPATVEALYLVPGEPPTSTGISVNPPAPARAEHVSPALPFDNRSLFSDHYLTDRLPGLREWKEDVSAPSAVLRSLYAKERDRLEGMSEAQLEEEWVKPILRDVLGWSYEVQTPVTGMAGQTKRPDYALFTDEERKRVAGGRIKDEGAFYDQAAAIAEAKYWDRPLDREVRKEVRDITQTNPSFQIVSYLFETGVQWGILTNGKEWRLYSGRARSRVDTYYAVDLERIIQEGDEDAFRYFYLFFRAAAFRADPATGQSFVQAVLEGTVSYARELERRLKDLVFDQIFPHLARGLVAWRRENGVETETDESLREIYEGTLRLLYRLLFLLHAEARELLPVHERGYARYSLNRIKRNIAEWIDRGDPFSTRSTNWWNDLAALFDIVDRGDPEVGVPRYNGGLFRADAPRNRFLREHRIGDKHLAPALDLLARAGGKEFIDYKALNVEQLGSLYEGLLEFRLRLDESGVPFLVNDKGERKATGSYYTPHYIVEYIVAETVGPVLAERVSRFRGLMDQIEEKRGRILRSRSHDAKVRLGKEVESLGEDAVDALLGIRICDPAMGSGHFLVHTTDWLTEQLMVVLNEYPANPVLGRIAEIRAQIVESLKAQKIEIDPESLKDTHLLKRMVMKQCIYGVDLNPMATELAKLSLWLDSFTVGAPLSFLDHHLRTGNSLVGTWVEDLRRDLESGDTPQFEVFGGPFAGLLLATRDMREVAALTDATFEEVARSSDRFHHYEETIAPYKHLLDLWLSRHFGNERAELMVKLYTDQVLDAAKGKPTKLKQYHYKAMDAARQTAGEQYFFHWELEFPEVFIDLEHARWKENPGFDAVIGNPPYVRQEKLAPLKPFLKTRYESFHGAADLYLYFYELGLDVLCESGRLAYISSGTFARANFAAEFRKTLLIRAQIESIIDFGENQPFEGAEMVRPSIIVLRRGTTGAPFRSLFIEDQVPESLHLALQELGFDCDPDCLVQPEWTFQPAIRTQIFTKILQSSTTLEEAVNGRMYRGLLTGLNEAFIVDDEVRNRLVSIDPSSGELIKKVLRGEDLRPWYQEDEGRWLIVIPNTWTRRTFRIAKDEERAWTRLHERYPAIADHLSRFAEAARARTDKGQFWWELRACDYYDAFDQTKIFWPDIAKLPRFSWGDPEIYSNNTCYFSPTDNPFLLGVLQSRCAWFSIMQLCQPLRLRGGLWQYRLFPQFLSRLPIPEAPSIDREDIGSLATEITKRSRARYDLHQKVRRRIAQDLNPQRRELNRALAGWWGLDFSGFRAEVKKALRQEIPLRERDDWAEWLNEQRDEHNLLTAEIVSLETDLNKRVYELFDLASAEIRTIEETTKYAYGEV
ncbi:MAG TPA: N-6 DNA methylase [Longimicrobiaceae bacterium]|nr:N-6 DNA methylase [Longimicrobiaceae bacterium]